MIIPKAQNLQFSQVVRCFQNSCHPQPRHTGMMEYCRDDPHFCVGDVRDDISKVLHKLEEFS